MQFYNLILITMTEDLPSHMGKVSECDGYLLVDCGQMCSTRSFLVTYSQNHYKILGIDFDVWNKTVWACQNWDPIPGTMLKLVRPPDTADCCAICCWISCWQRHKKDACADLLPRKCTNQSGTWDKCAHIHVMFQMKASVKVRRKYRFCRVFGVTQKLL